MLMEAEGGSAVAATTGESSPRVMLGSLADPLFTNAAMSGSLAELCRHTSCIVLSRGRAMETAMAPRPLMLATARGGRELYAIGRRRMAVGDDTFLIVNEGREHSSV